MIHMKIKKNSTFQVTYGNIWKFSIQNYNRNTIEKNSFNLKFQ